MSPLLRRSGALLAAAALTGAGLVATTAPARAAGSDPRPVTVGASWLTDHLVNGVIRDSYLDVYTDPEHPTPVEYDDLGLTMDTAMSLVAVGGHASTVASIKSALDARITETYDQGAVYTGSAAKAAVYDRLVGGDPTDVGSGHVDLVKVITDNTATTGAVAGKIQNGPGSFGDTNTFGQAFAVRALAEAGSDLADEAEAFLLEQQCTAGFFRLNPAATAGEDQTCQAQVGTDASAPDTDATAIAMLQLEALGTQSDAVKAAIASARAWLLDQQLANGSFGGGPSTSAPNANSTGLAGMALAGTGDLAAARAAAIWVRSLQADEVGTCTSKLSEETGGIGYDAGTVSDGRADGITVQSKDRWLRTTAPVLPVLQYAPAATPSLDITGPAGYVHGGSLVSYRITGAVPGDKLCVAGFGRHKFAVGGADGSARVYLTAPASTGARTVRVSDRGGNSSGVRTEVLGARTLSVAPSPSVAPRSSYVAVTVSGLAPGEKVSVLFRGTLRHRGFADTRGVYRTKVGAGSTLGTGSIYAVGAFADRKGSHLVKVVR